MLDGMFTSGLFEMKVTICLVQADEVMMEVRGSSPE